VEGESAPVPGEYLPPWHKVHAAEPLTSLYDPATHAVHVPPSRPVYPILHVQSVTSSLPRPEYASEGHARQAAFDVSPVPDEYLPPWHKVQGDDPITSLYDPATHAGHAPPSGPVCPILQVQSEMVELPTPEKLKEGQIVHVAADVSAISAEYLPPGHRAHADDPITSLYDPATHAEHVPPLGPE